MLLALVLQAAAPQTAVDAERAFNAAAQAKGQWTAFREFAAPDAVMFVPQPVKAHDWLKDRKNPPRSVEWQPAVSYMSCDGKVAVNSGNWQRPDGSIGYFTTIWSAAGGSWKWLADHGDGVAVARPLPGFPGTVRAQCTGRAKPPLEAPLATGKTGSGHSPDGTLLWRWDVWPDGSRVLMARIWTGQSYEVVINDRVAAPK